MSRRKKGVVIPPKNDDIIYEQPLTFNPMTINAKGELLWREFNRTVPSALQRSSQPIVLFHSTANCVGSLSLRKGLLLNSKGFQNPNMVWGPNCLFLTKCPLLLAENGKRISTSWFTKLHAFIYIFLVEYVHFHTGTKKNSIWSRNE